MLKQRIAEHSKMKRNMKRLGQLQYHYTEFRSDSGGQGAVRGSQRKTWTPGRPRNKHRALPHGTEGGFSSCRVKSGRGIQQQGRTGACRTGPVPLKERTTMFLESSMEKREGARITAPHQLSSNSGSAAHCETEGLQDLLCGFVVWVKEIAVTSSTQCLVHNSYSANMSNISCNEIYILCPQTSW